VAETRFPNVLYIGTDRSGSTWLADYLRWHPDAFVPSVKELFFFDRYYDRGLEWYGSHFRDATQPICAEVCHDYLYSALAAKRIHDFDPNIRLIVFLREPVSRTISAYRYKRKFGLTGDSLDAALQDAPELIEHSMYSTHIDEYLKRFRREQMYVGVFDDLVEDPVAFARSISTWLGVTERGLPSQLLRPSLPAASARYAPAANLARRVAGYARDRRLERVVGVVKRSAVVQKTLFTPAGDSDGAIDSAAVQRLRARFATDVTAVDQLVGTNLSLRWGYSGAGVS
jgi:Sulfotransferase domain